MPKVSVCCSVLNQSGWLLDMIASVVAQTYQDWELIIVDDGSTEPVRKVVEKFKDPRIVFERWDHNRGIPHGINHAFRHGNGKYVQPLAADEILSPDKLEKQVAFLEAHPEIDCVWGLPQFCDGREYTTLGERPMWEQYATKAHNRSREAWIRTLLLLESVPLGSCSALWRASVFDSIGYFDKDLTAFVDHEWYVRFFEKHTGYVMNQRVALCRPNPDNQGALKHAERNRLELERIRQEHPIQLPATTGKVTVGIPVYNMAHFIGDAIESVLAQTHQDFELLILDDASTDNIAEVVSKYEDPRIRFYRMEENCGAHVATNQLAARAEGLFFVPLSADDTIEPNFLEKCLAEFKTSPFLEFVASQTDFIDEKGEPYTADHPFKTIERACNRSQGRVEGEVLSRQRLFRRGMYRTSAFLECGGRKPQFGVISDYELYLNLVHRENIKVIEENLTHTRIHGKNMSLLNQEQAGKAPLSISRREEELLPEAHQSDSGDAFL
jgi:glycosyltransferase involved in cell wall biosynthesis